MGKGSVPRPFSVPRKKFADNFERIFARAKPVALCKQGSDEVVAYACGACGVVAGSPKTHGSDEEAQEQARDHCGPWFCSDCGAKMEYRYSCRACRDAAYTARETKRWEDAKDITAESYGGPVTDGDDRFWGSTDEAEDELEDPTWLFACDEFPFAIDVDDVLEHALEEHHEDASERLHDVEELAEFLKAWSAKQDIVSWQADYSRKLLVIPYGFCTKCHRGPDEVDLINDGDDSMGPTVCPDCYESGVEDGGC